MIYEPMPGYIPVAGLFLGEPMLMDFACICHALPEEQRREYEAFAGVAYDPEAVALDLAGRAGPRWVLMTPQYTPLGIAGFQGLGNGIWQDWLIATDDAWSRYGKATTRACQRVLEIMFTSGEARRIQAMVSADRERVRRWYHLVGYEYEGTLRAYGAQGQDVVIYARTQHG